MNGLVPGNAEEDHLDDVPVRGHLFGEHLIVLDLF